MECQVAGGRHALQACHELVADLGYGLVFLFKNGEIGGHRAFLGSLRLHFYCLHL